MNITKIMKEIGLFLIIPAHTFMCAMALFTSILIYNKYIEDAGNYAPDIIPTESFQDLRFKVSFAVSAKEVIGNDLVLCGTHRCITIQGASEIYSRIPSFVWIEIQGVRHEKPGFLQQATIAIDGQVIWETPEPPSGM